jgi:ubiquinone/menaquinone biosynthesis C-methylase UbiE
MNDSTAHAARNAAKFDAWAPTYEDPRFDFFRRMQKRVLGLLDLKRGAAFLDIGCGTGWAVRAAAELVGPGGDAYGVDLSPRMIQNATESARGTMNAHFKNANAEKLPFKLDSFDVIICTMSFHHYLNPGKAVGEMARVLKPGGKLCIVDPTADFFVMKWIDGILKRREPEHVALYSTLEFRQFLEGASLRYLESRRAFFPWITAKAHIATK